MTMHTCIIANLHIHAQIAMGCESHVRFRERKLPLRGGACCAVLARRARALAGVWACRALGSGGRARRVAAGERLLVCELAWHVLGAGERLVRACAMAYWVLGPSSTAAHARFCARGDGTRGPVVTSRPVGPAVPCAVCSVPFAGVFCRMLCVLQCRVVLCVMLRSGRARCRVRCRVFACGGGVSRVCRVLGACAALRRR